MRGLGGNKVGAVAHVNGEHLYLIRNGNKIFTHSSTPLDSVNNYDIGDDVVLDHPNNGISSEKFLIDPNTSNDSNPTMSSKTTWYPIDGNYSFIGGEDTPNSTNVALNLEFPGSSRSDEPKFSKGDSIKIKCEGLKLEENSASVKIDKDLSSIKQFGKRESKEGNSKFLDENTALWLAIKEVDENSSPRYNFVVKSIVTPWLELLDVVDVQDPVVLPGSTQRKESCYIQQISFPASMAGTQTIYLRAINPY